MTLLFCICSSSCILTFLSIIDIRFKLKKKKKIIRSYIKRVTSRTREKIAWEVAVRGDSGVAGEGRIVSVPKFIYGLSTPCHSNINSDLVSNASSGLRIILCYITRILNFFLKNKVQIK